MPYFDILMMIVCAVIYYRIGEMEYKRGFPLGAVSIVVWIVTSYVLGWYLLYKIGAQVGIFIALTLYNVFIKK